MRVLFDQGTPVPLRHALTGHVVSTAFEMGWSEMANGDLLVLPTTSWPLIQPHVAEVVAALDELLAGTLLELRFSK